MWDFNLSGAMSAVVRIAAFVVVQLVAYIGIAQVFLTTIEGQQPDRQRKDRLNTAPVAASANMRPA